MFDVGCSGLDVGCSMFGVGCWMFGFGSLHLPRSPFPSRDGPRVGKSDLQRPALPPSNASTLYRSDAPPSNGLLTPRPGFCMTCVGKLRPLPLSDRSDAKALLAPNAPPTPPSRSRAA